MISLPYTKKINHKALGTQKSVVQNNDDEKKKSRKGGGGDNEEGMNEEIDKQISGERVYVDNATPLVSSIFTSMFTVTILYSISTPKDIWLLFFILVDVAVSTIKSLIAKYYFTRMESDDLDNLIIMQFFRFIHTTLILMLMKIVLDIMTFIILTSTMYWYNYVDIGLVLFCFLFVIFSKLK